MSIGASHVANNQTVTASDSAPTGSVAERWYGPFLGVCSLATIAFAYQFGWYPAWDTGLILSLAVAMALLIGGELFIIALPFSWGTVQVSVGSIAVLAWPCGSDRFMRQL